MTARARGVPILLVKRSTTKAFALCLWVVLTASRRTQESTPRIILTFLGSLDELLGIFDYSAGGCVCVCVSLYILGVVLILSLVYAGMVQNQLPNVNVPQYVVVVLVPCEDW